jgi:SAM-dependent methyltransferase
MTKIIHILVRIVAATPFYPHWLEFRRLQALSDKMAGLLHGRVIEVGAGDGAFKKKVLATNQRIENYMATDFTSWDGEFAENDRIAESGNLMDALYGRTKREVLDARCSALELPFPDKSFDCHVSVEVLEHIPDPEQYFREAARVVKPGGLVLVMAPFLFRIHPDEQSDFFRMLPGGYEALAKRHGLSVVTIESNTGAGASTSYLMNQWLIRLYLESRLGPVKWIFLPLLPFLFAHYNFYGWLMDKFSCDRRFASRFMVVLRKPA